MTKIIATSDLHGARPDIGECDILILAGDVVGHPTNAGYNRFFEWLADIPARDIVLIAGNHDNMLLYDHPDSSKYHTLFNETVVINGISIFGSPYSKPFNNWNFMPNDDVRFDAYMMMPDNLDILVTHGPQHMILDRSNYGEILGDRVLGDVIRARRPYMHVFGHIHEGYGYSRASNIHSFNVAYTGDYFDMTNKPVEIVLDNNKKLK